MQDPPGELTITGTAQREAWLGRVMPRRHGERGLMTAGPDVARRVAGRCPAGDSRRP